MLTDPLEGNLPAAVGHLRNHAPHPVADELFFFENDHQTGYPIGFVFMKVPQPLPVRSPSELAGLPGRRSSSNRGSLLPNPSSEHHRKPPQFVSLSRFPPLSAQKP